MPHKSNKDFSGITTNRAERKSLLVLIDNNLGGIVCNLLNGMDWAMIL